MNWTITNIAKGILGKAHKDYSQRTVTFIGDDDVSRAVTYVSRQMRNAELWDKHMEVGVTLAGLRLIRHGLIDADSIRYATRVQAERTPKPVHMHESEESPQPTLGVFKTPATRELTHGLEYIVKDDRWRCKCGYELGHPTKGGHDALYALCPLRAREKPIEAPVKRVRGRRVERRSYLDFKITDSPSKEAQELFDL